MKLLDPDHLARGSEEQRAAYAALQSLNLFADLASEHPVLAGDWPLGIATAESPIEVLFAPANLVKAADSLQARYGTQTDFTMHHKLVKSQPAVSVRFVHGGLKFHVLAVTGSVFSQEAVVQLLLEARLLAFAPKDAAAHVRNLKASGLSTPEAFAACFELNGSPAEELAKLAQMPDHEILHIAHRFHFRIQ